MRVTIFDLKTMAGFGAITIGFREALLKSQRHQLQYFGFLRVLIAAASVSAFKTRSRVLSQGVSTKSGFEDNIWIHPSTAVPPTVPKSFCNLPLNCLLMFYWPMTSCDKLTWGAGIPNSSDLRGKLITTIWGLHHLSADPGLKHPQGQRWPSAPRISVAMKIFVTQSRQAGLAG